MQDDINPTSEKSQTPVEGVSSVNSMPQSPVLGSDENPVVSPQVANEAVTAPPVEVSPQVPQGQDKSDAMTYPLGSQDVQPEVSPQTPLPEEDHRTILDRIMGIFNKGKKDQPENAQSEQPASIDHTPTNTTLPPSQ